MEHSGSRARPSEDCQRVQLKEDLFKCSLFGQPRPPAALCASPPRPVCVCPSCCPVGTLHKTVTRLEHYHGYIISTTSHHRSAGRPSQRGLDRDGPRLLRPRPSQFVKASRLFTALEKKNKKYSDINLLHENKHSGFPLYSCGCYTEVGIYTCRQEMRTLYLQL